jgi:hypothetical protein
LTVENTTALSVAVDEEAAAPQQNTRAQSTRTSRVFSPSQQQHTRKGSQFSRKQQKRISSFSFQNYKQQPCLILFTARMFSQQAASKQFSSFHKKKQLLAAPRLT